MDLISAKKGEKLKIVGLDGGEEFIKKLNSLGISDGKTIIKISSLRLKGPIIISIDRASVAIGRNMAKRIIVERS